MRWKIRDGGSWLGLLLISFILPQTTFAQGQTPTRFNLDGFNDLKLITTPSGVPDAYHHRFYAKTSSTACIKTHAGTEICFGIGNLTSLNGLTGPVQTFATPGTTGTAPNWVSSGTAHTLHIPMANAATVTAGLISKSEFDIFNAKIGGSGTVDYLPIFTAAASLGDSPCSFVAGVLTCTGGASFGGTGTSYFTGPVDLGGNALTNTVLNAEGTGNVLTTVQFISFEGICQNTTGSFSFDLPPTNPAVAACPTGTNIPVRGSLDFNDTTRNNAYGSIWLPPDWTATGGVDVDIEWFAAATTGHVVWRVATTCTAKDAAYDGALNAASTVTSTAEGTTNLRNVASITGIDVTGCAATNTGTRMFFNFYRLPTDAADDMAGDARLVALRFKTRRAQ
jgi:hypothetical protein